MMATSQARVPRADGKPSIAIRSSCDGSTSTVPSTGQDHGEGRALQVMLAQQLAPLVRAVARRTSTAR